MLVPINEVVDHYEDLCIRCNSIMRKRVCVSCASANADAGPTSTGLVIFNDENGEMIYFEEIWLH
jgi:hypothetical protein